MLVANMHGQVSRLVQASEIIQVQKETLGALCCELEFRDSLPSIYLCQSVIRTEKGWRVKLARIG